MSSRPRAARFRRAVLTCSTSLVVLGVVCTTTASAVPGSSAPQAADGGASVRVADGGELKEALASAEPGQTIELADGVYAGNFKINRPGERENRIILTGSADAVLTAPSGGGYGLHVDSASHWTIHGVTVTGGQKGVMVDASDYVVLDSITVHDLTMEGVHFRRSSSHGVLKNSTVRDTGTDGRGMGEGVYIGSANTLEDRSDRVRIENNTIGPRVRGENVDIKEGTTGGTVSGNTFHGDGLANVHYDDSWVDVKGNDYLIENNTGVGTLNDGYQTHSPQPGWGCGTVFRGNDSDLTGATGSGRYAFEITNHDAASCPVTIASDNTVTGGDGSATPGVPIG
ncbi:right-handed parallel beta-helix repeat-containing protein [Streptomyces sp. P38-E01]|uniref:Right-handed parallel beta-helix repeat-containing protein n=1 Tax=Streptomyces tardus TaxID=2780544 RepID=A0A949JIU5_9ACTN|nr:right-handed parallel beta-helix repeat-containing protein [Streptomyces tardus]MBU7599444.1 right-handed parallel beta-helix repeat-containing protein [Streptomyces tardus]